MKIKTSDRTTKRSAPEAVAKAVETELVADTIPAALDPHSWSRARSAFRIYHIRAAIENADFLTKAHSFANADDCDGKEMYAAFTECERMQMISLLTQVCAAQKLTR